MADITRNHFDESRGVIKKILQQGRHLVDADWNEQADAHTMVSRRMLSALLNHTNYRFGDGFKLVGTGASLALTVNAGRAAFQIGTQSAVMLNLAADYTLSGFTAFPGGGRTDYVYIDIYESEVTSATDPDIVSPSLGQETCVDLRLQFAFAISEGGVPGAAPAGHTYISLGTVTSTDNAIAAGDVANLIASFYDPVYIDIGGTNLLRNGSFELFYENDPTFFSSARFWTDTFPLDGYGGGGVRESSVVRSGQYSIIFGGGTTGNQGYICQIIPNVKRYAGRKIRFSVWVTCNSADAGSEGKTIRLWVYDGVNTTTGSSVTLTTPGTWVELIEEHTISANATTLAVQIKSGPSVGSWGCYADDASLFVGPSPRSFEPNVQDAVDAYDVALDAVLGAVELPLFCDNAQSHTDADAVGLTDSTIRHMATSAGSAVTRTVIRLPYYHLTAYKTLVLRCEAYGTGTIAGAEVRIKNGAGTAVATISETSAARKLLWIDMSALSAGNTTDITVEIYAYGTCDIFIQKVQIGVKFGV